ncbi:MAG: glucose-1-phosphate adenylyltransferase subunit GlgD, partial [Streptococcaceae bacterium]|nr:glucose-1-phosphate adenylyltransferase subunit GlgD [Streptococcaceae bacterium]
KKYSPSKLSDLNTILEISEDNLASAGHGFDPEIDTDERVNMSMGIFVVETKWLIKHLREAYQTNLPPSLQYWLDAKTRDEETAAYEFVGYVSNVFDVQSYYRANLDMLDPANFNTLFFSSNKIYTKVKNEAPTYFSKDSDVKASQFASGSVVKGEVKDSIISRNVKIETGAKVHGSIIMPSCKIESGAEVVYAIVDKNVTVKSTAKIIGSPEAPIVIAKGSIIE